MQFEHLFLDIGFNDNATGNKVNNIDVVYTPWANLKKTASMDVGQVGFHNSKMVTSHLTLYDLSL